VVSLKKLVEKEKEYENCKNRVYSKLKSANSSFFSNKTCQIPITEAFSEEIINLVKLQEELNYFQELVNFTEKFLNYSSN
jgi:hypothetical protein